MFVVFFKFVVSWFFGLFKFRHPESKVFILKNTEELDAPTKKKEKERKKQDESKHNSGGVVNSMTKEEQDRKKEEKEESNTVKRKRIKAELLPPNINSDREDFTNLLKEALGKDKDETPSISTSEILKAKINKRNSGINQFKP